MRPTAKSVGSVMAVEVRMLNEAQHDSIEQITAQRDVYKEGLEQALILLAQDGLTLNLMYAAREIIAQCLQPKRK